MKKKLFYISVAFIVSFFISIDLCAITNSFNKQQAGVSVIVIDPGHGGIDLGASVGHIHEKDIALGISLKLGELIKNNFPEIKIIYTRSNDVFVSVYERAQIANQNKSDLFISIHVNAVEQTYVKGTETFVLGQHRTKENLEVAKKENAVILLEDDYHTTYEGFDPDSPESYIMFELIQNEYLGQSVLFASEIQKQLQNVANRKNRSVKQSGFIVLRQITMPGVLIEAGFISNMEERNYLYTNKGQSEIATSVFNAFKEYRKQIEEKSNFIVRTESDSNVMDTNTENNSGIDSSMVSESTTELFFSVQFLASKRKFKPSKFKGEEQVFRKDDENISRYFSGRFYNYNDAIIEKERIKKKYHEAFVVAFENGELISLKKALDGVN